LNSPNCRASVEPIVGRVIVADLSATGSTGFGLAGLALLPVKGSPLAKVHSAFTSIRHLRQSRMPEEARFERMQGER
jgi:hypothetical protein